MDAYWETMQASAHRGPSPHARDHRDVRAVADSVLVLAVADGSGGTDARRGFLGARWAVEEMMRRAIPLAHLVAEVDGDVGRWPLLVEHAGRLGGAVCRDWRERARTHEANGPADGVQRAGVPVRDAKLAAYGSSVLGAVLSPTLLFCWQLGGGDITVVGDRGIKVLFDEGGRGHRPGSLCDVRPGRSMRFHWQRADALGGCRLVLLNTDGLSRAFTDRADYHGFVANLYGRSVRRGTQSVRERLGGWLDHAAERSDADATLVAAYADH